MSNFKSIVTGAAALVLLGLQGSASAGTIIGGSSMLTSGYVAQLETWLGEGPLALSNIFTKGVTGNNSADWHNSVDNSGRTFSVIKIEVVDPESQQNVTQIIGGYNPQSWHTGGANNTPNDTDRTAFIFNLTTGVIQRQCLSTDHLNCGQDGFNFNGQAQTENDISAGPAFGNGPDIYVFSSLDSGISYNYSYGVPGGLVGFNDTNGIDSYTNNVFWTVSALETFTIAADTTTVPEPGTLVLFGLGLACLGYTRRKRIA